MARHWSGHKKIIFQSQRCAQTTICRCKIATRAKFCSQISYYQSIKCLYEGAFFEPWWGHLALLSEARCNLYAVLLHPWEDWHWKQSEAFHSFPGPTFKQLTVRLFQMQNSPLQWILLNPFELVASRCVGWFPKKHFLYLLFRLVSWRLFQKHGNKHHKEHGKM